MERRWPFWGLSPTPANMLMNMHMGNHTFNQNQGDRGVLSEQVVASGLWVWQGCAEEAYMPDTG